VWRGSGCPAGGVEAVAGFWAAFGAGLGDVGAVLGDGRVRDPLVQARVVARGTSDTGASPPSSMSPGGRRRPRRRMRRTGRSRRKLFELLLQQGLLREEVACRYARAVDSLGCGPGAGPESVPSLCRAGRCGACRAFSRLGRLGRWLDAGVATEGQRLSDSLVADRGVGKPAGHVGCAQEAATEATEVRGISRHSCVRVCVIYRELQSLQSLFGVTLGL